MAPEPVGVALSFNAPSPSLHSVTPDNRQQFGPHHGTGETQRSQGSYECVVTRVAPHAVSRQLRPLRRNCAAASAIIDGLLPTYAGPSDSAERADSVTIGSELGKLQSPGQGSLRVPAYTYRAEQSGSPSPRTPRLSSRRRSRGEGLQESQHGLVATYPSSSNTDSHITFSYGEARPANTPTVCPSTALLQSPQSERVSRFPRIEDCQEIHRNATCMHGHSLSVSASALADGYVGIGSEGATNSLSTSEPLG